MKKFLLLTSLLLSLTGYSQTSKSMTKKTIDDCDTLSPQKLLTCKLTSPEMQQRKATVFASLKKKIIFKKELPNGLSYQFKGTDANIDELASFIKTERLCCDFFDFSLTVKVNGTSALLTITGPKGAKDFIKTELDL